MNEDDLVHVEWKLRSPQHGDINIEGNFTPHDLGYYILARVGTGVWTFTGDRLAEPVRFSVFGVR